MADNIAVTEGSGKTVKTEDIGGAQYQVIKVALGPDGSASDLDVGQTNMASSIPVVIASDQSAISTTTEAPAQAVTRAAGTKAGAGDNELVATPGAGQRIVVAFWTAQNESAVATTVIMKSGATNVFRFLAQNQGDVYGVDFFPGREWNLAENEALNMNLSGANSHGYNVGYWTEAT